MIRCFLPAWRPEYGVTRLAWKKLSGLERSKLIKAWRDDCNAGWLAQRLVLSDEQIAEGWISEKPPFPPDYKSEILDPANIELHGFEPGFL